MTNGVNRKNMAVLTTKNDWLDFSPSNLGEKAHVYAAPILIERAIIEGSGGPENVPTTKAGLRFIRYLLALLPYASIIYMPNFKNIDTIKNLARLFIDNCGGAAQALQIMQTVMHSINEFSDCP